MRSEKNQIDFPKDRMIDRLFSFRQSRRLFMAESMMRHYFPIRKRILKTNKTHGGAAMENNEKAIVELFEVCSRAIDQKMDQNQRTAAEERLQQEMDIAREEGLACLFLDLKKFIENYGIQTWEIFGRDCWTGSSLTAFLLGISEMNPLLLHIPVTFLNIDVEEIIKTRHSVVEFNIPYHYVKLLDLDEDIHKWGFMPSARSSGYDSYAPIRVRFTCGMKQNIDLSTNLEKIYRMAKMTGMRPDRIDADEQEVLTEMKDIIRKEAEDYLRKGEDGHPVEEYCDPMILEAYKPRDIYQFGKLISLVYNKPLWKTNLPIRNSGGELKDLITCRDDIYDICKNYGIDSQRSYLIAHDTAFGLWRRGKFQKREEYEKMMRLSGMPEYYVQAIEGSFNLFSRSRNTKIALNQYRLAWYKVHYKDVYDDTINGLGK